MWKQFLCTRRILLQYLNFSFFLLWGIGIKCELSGMQRELILRKLYNELFLMLYFTYKPPFPCDVGSAFRQLF